MLLHDVCTYIYTAASNVRGLQAGSLLANSTRNMHNSIHLCTNAHVLTMKFYYVTLQSVKAPVAAN